MFVNLKVFAQKLGAVKRETRSHCYRSELNQNERFRPKSDVTFAAYHIEKKRFWILRLENFERKKSQKHKYRGTQPANLAESITRGMHWQRGERPGDLRVQARHRSGAVLSAGRAVLAGSR